MRGKLADSIFLHVIPPVGSALVRFVGATWRYTVLHQEEIEKARTVGNAVLYALWHGRMLPPVHFYRDHSICALVSQHRDGEFASRVANKLGHDTVRGSSTRGGAKGFNELLRKIESGLDAAILPDGPNGLSGSARHHTPGSLQRMSHCPYHGRSIIIFQTEKLGPVPYSQTFFALRYCVWPGDRSVAAGNTRDHGGET